ncbi:hypothetical protein GCM10010106_43020 [Thermopolyspora flexuosa]|jgi:energy-coupling factor transporter ATP-binding protein EcfA2|uniref:Dynamin family protein n=2 Tax=Thermopolyspora flexuosa TaxID=103836 RepID=A0A543IV05_9ACTN|nr:GTPase [Thermopolyspora flexuosa]TQM74408.1 dynamin family protein [Thermopolyspora flexuosa]GGM90860.1 hypothetical protein GCM10010106_43020 [Thermopolyspora flexuosa]
MGDDTESPGEQTLSFEPIRDEEGADPSDADPADAADGPTRPTMHPAARARAAAPARDEPVTGPGGTAVAPVAGGAPSPERAGPAAAVRQAGPAGLEWRPSRVAEDPERPDPPKPEPDREANEAAKVAEAAPETAGETAGEPASAAGRPEPETEPAAEPAAEPAKAAEAGDEATGETGSEPERAEPAAEQETAPEPEPETGRADEDTPPRTREVPVPEPVSRAFSAALAELRESLIGLNFGLDLPGAVEARKVQAEILSQLGNYVIPRVHMSTAPALVVVAGSTGAGKSTIVNSLAGTKVSATGVRRPTTGTPVLVCHPNDREWFARGNVLSGLTRVTRPGLGPSMSSFVLTTSPGLPENIALLDTPDIDSAVEEHHEIAHRMLDVADLWVFVTTAARYADAPAWHLLKLAKERGARFVIVVARVTPKARDVVLKHFGRMLDDYGLGDVERFVIHETTVTDGRLPDEEIAELRTWLEELSVDDDRRARAIRTTLDGALNSFRVRIPALARQLEAQVAFRAELRTDVDAAYMAALAEIDEATRNGSLLRGEVLARWQDFVGSGDIRHALQHLRRPGRFASKARQEAPMRLRALKQAVASGLESIIVAAAQRAAEDVVTRWRNRSPVGERLAATPGLGKPSDELVRRAGEAVSAWQDHIVELVRTEGVTKRSIARVLSVDVDSLAVIFTVGLLGYEFADTATTSTKGSLPERLLRGLLGAESLRNIAAKARSDLRARISMLFDEETVRHVHVLDSAGIPDESAAARLYQATYNLEVAR